ncbi:MAG: hypothetical protein Q4F72_05735 [Desulfovibrionaceae bacterium]|nr:hypothetical protein [Desulfovibrionaceae bacterium]
MTQKTSDNTNDSNDSTNTGGTASRMAGLLDRLPGKMAGTREKLERWTSGRKSAGENSGTGSGQAEQTAQSEQPGQIEQNAQAEPAAQACQTEQAIRTEQPGQAETSQARVEDKDAHSRRDAAVSRLLKDLGQDLPRSPREAMDRLKAGLKPAADRKGQADGTSAADSASALQAETGAGNTASQKAAVAAELLSEAEQRLFARARRAQWWKTGKTKTEPETIDIGQKQKAPEPFWRNVLHVLECLGILVGACIGCVCLVGMRMVLGGFMMVAVACGVVGGIIIEIRNRLSRRAKQAEGAAGTAEATAEGPSDGTGSRAVAGSHASAGSAHEDGSGSR